MVVGVATIGSNLQHQSETEEDDHHFLVSSVNWNFEYGDFIGLVVTSLTNGAYLPKTAYFDCSTINRALMTEHYRSQYSKCVAHSF